MNEVLRTKEFDAWFNKLDRSLRVKIDIRISRIAMGNFGDQKRLTEIIYETRIHVHSGIRLYYMWRGMEVVLMLGGGDKDSQRKDIEKAKRIASDILEKENECL